ncbi:MAG: hypothetical protein DMG21_08965 [Acidobacteria bacterium]|nr:MAG: hypothetical protein DMG21_08965 [Acidobacteriota bacterium]
MESVDYSNRFAPWVGSMGFAELVASRPEAAFLLVQFLSEEVQAADGQLRMVWEEIPAGFPIGDA